MMTGQSIASELFPVIADAAVRGILLTVLAGIAVLGLRSRSAATRHLVWTIAVAGLLALPLLRPALPELSVPVTWMAGVSAGVGGEAPASVMGAAPALDEPRLEGPIWSPPAETEVGRVIEATSEAFPVVSPTHTEWLRREARSRRDESMAGHAETAPGGTATAEDPRGGGLGVGPGWGEAGVLLWIAGAMLALLPLLFGQVRAVEMGEDGRIYGEVIRGP